MTFRRIIISLIFILSLSLTGCGDVRDREMLKQARGALKGGDTKVAIRNTKAVLQRSPRNLYARYVMREIKSTLLKDAKENLKAGNYKEAVNKVESLLDLDPEHEEGKTIRTEAKKYVLLADAKTALANDNPIGAVRSLQEATRLDPNFEEAKKLEAEANVQVEIRIANLVTTAEQLIEQENFERLRDLAQDILAIDPQNRQAADLLREAQAQILARNKEENLTKARQFYQEGIYESALLKAEEVLKVDPNSLEGKELMEKSKAELEKPELRLTGLTKIKGMEIAHIEVVPTREKFQVRQGDTFLNNGDFKVSAVDLDLKAVVLTFTKTGSQQTITISSE